MPILLIILLSGCANQAEPVVNDDNGHDVTEAFYYIKETLSDVELESILDFYLDDESLNVIGYNDISMDNEAGDYDFRLELKLVKLSFSGEKLGEIVFDPQEISFWHESPAAAASDENGGIWIMFNLSGPESGTYLRRYDANGNLTKTALIGETQGIKSFHVTGSGDDETIYIYSDNLSMSVLRAYDNDAELKFEISGVNGIAVLADGQVLIERSEKNKQNEEKIFQIIDAKGNVSSEIKIDVNANEQQNNPYFHGTRFDTTGLAIGLVETGDKGLYGYHLDKGRRFKLLDWLEHGINFSFSGLARLIVAAGDDFYCLVPEDSKVKMVRLARTYEPPEVAGKKIITLALLYSEFIYGGSIARFNINNENYEIKVERFNTESMNLRLASGNIPDIVIMPPNDSYYNYSYKGLFVDLYELINADPDIELSDYIDNVLITLEHNDKLYGIPPYFSINTVIGRMSDVGQRTGWTWDEFHALMESKPDGTVPVAWRDRPLSGSDFFFNAISGRSSDFIDYAKMECNFNSPEFINFLEMVKAYYPSGAYYRAMAENYLSGNPLLMSERIERLNERSTAEYEKYFGEEVSYIGYPTSDGRNGSSFHFNDVVAISAKSEMVDGAFEYLKYLLTDAQFRVVDGYYSLEGNEALFFGFPIHRTALEQIFEMFIEINEGAGEGFYFDGTRIPTRTDINKVYDLINAVTSASGIWGIYQIIEEELESFLSGQKSAEEAADIIQNRASLLMAELN
ncbi:MAG: extracellular solute-binding protein [Lachnospiraceae bacterium]|nr:extracellular solute-binding protein [Lachnospiraceae bacterium]